MQQKRFCDEQIAAGWLINELLLVRQGLKESWLCGCIIHNLQGPVLRAAMLLRMKAWLCNSCLPWLQT